MHFAGADLLFGVEDDAVPPTGDKSAVKIVAEEAQRPLSASSNLTVLIGRGSRTAAVLHETMIRPNNGGMFEIYLRTEEP
ncbi:hypothetical protein CSOJ01_06063 [Colletotrichum sojae]|uniref:Uncharacterized protein n=1 Tax=Colletotrichum sojae TaxID=2175907 RepID=A0A8H6JDR4_9PEZI|nr:hypothetical protein CSOJ01_06063 [Colletotrichum sojae]